MLLILSAAFKLIVGNAFTGTAAGGGFAGATVMMAILVSVSLVVCLQTNLA